MPALNVMSLCETAGKFQVMEIGLPLIVIVSGPVGDGVMHSFSYTRSMRSIVCSISSNVVRGLIVHSRSTVWPRSTVVYGAA